MTPRSLHKYPYTAILLLVFIVSCSAHTTVDHVRSQAATSDFVLLCEVDTNGPSVGYRLKKVLRTNTVPVTPFVVGQLLPFKGDDVEPSTPHRIIHYGDEAIVFTSTGPGSLDFGTRRYILVLHNGKSPSSDLSREDLIKLITEAPKK